MCIFVERLSYISGESMKYSIIGAAKSGIAASVLAKQLGHSVFLSESKNKADISAETINKIKQSRIDCEFGGNTNKALEVDCIIVSPGVPRHIPILIEAEKLKIPIISEMEFACQQIENPIIAITGTNGKTTTTSLIEHIFKFAGRKVIAAGNIGIPLSEYVNNLDADTIVVVEISSFQLDRIEKFHPQVAIIMNVTPDHLSYHGTMENYVETKWKIASNQNQNNLLILNYDDVTLSETKEKFLRGTPSIAYFSENSVPMGIGLKQDDIIFLQQHNEEVLMAKQDLALPGIHNTYNSMAAALAARYFDIPNDNIRESLKTFKAVEHRLELVRTIGGVAFVNDSKATNINSTWYALQSYKQPIIWIAGGRGDNNNYSLLDGFVSKNVSHIIAIGEEKEAIFNHYCTMKPCIFAEDMEDAVIKAYEVAEKQNVILLSPACKSFDMYDSYGHRGNIFKKIVTGLK